MGRPKKLRAADLFCGAGGSTTGAVASGAVDVVLAINHWRTAVLSHQANHPSTRHICARIDDVDPRNDRTLPELDLLMASPECTHHSNARGGRPIDDQKRATPWHVCVWAEAKRPEWIVVENVREFRDWGPLTKDGRPDKRKKGQTFQAWIRAIESIGYQVDHQLLNAADFGAATKRSRLFIVARRGRSRRDIPWPEPTHSPAQWRPAWQVIDWTKPCPSIFARKRPLADKTLARIEAGLRKFVGEAADPFVVLLRNNQDGASLAGPLSTICTSGAHHGLAVPFQFKMLGRNRGATKGIDEPLPTIVAARENHAVIVPFLETLTHGGREKSVDQPMPTITTAHRGEHAVVVPYLVPNFGEHAGQEPRTHDLTDPAPTVTGHGAGGLAMPFLLPRTGIYDSKDQLKRSRGMDEPVPTILASHSPGHVVLPFLTKYYGTGAAASVDEPLDVLTTHDRYGLAMVSLVRTMRELGIVDIGFRMLDVDELARAQGFPEGYELFGTKADRVRQIGNSVCPDVMRAICTTLAG